jgi:hypothetical protein
MKFTLQNLKSSDLVGNRIEAIKTLTELLFHKAESPEKQQLQRLRQTPKQLLIRKKISV